MILPYDHRFLPQIVHLVHREIGTPDCISHPVILLREHTLRTVNWLRGIWKEVSTTQACLQDGIFAASGQQSNCPYMDVLLVQQLCHTRLWATLGRLFFDLIAIIIFPIYLVWIVWAIINIQYLAPIRLPCGPNSASCPTLIHVDWGAIINLIIVELLFLSLLIADRADIIFRYPSKALKSTYKGIAYEALQITTLVKIHCLVCQINRLEEQDGILQSQIAQLKAERSLLPPDPRKLRKQEANRRGKLRKRRANRRRDERKRTREEKVLTRRIFLRCRDSTRAWNESLEREPGMKCKTSDMV